MQTAAQLFDVMLQMLREKCLALEDDVRALNDRLKQTEDIVAEKDRCIAVCDTGLVELFNVNVFLVLCFHKTTFQIMCFFLFVMCFFLFVNLCHSCM